MDKIDNCKNNPKVLIVSNNSLSMTNNNGKTLESFFSSFDANQISQLYFSSEVPNSSVCDSFFRISDRDIVHNLFKNNFSCGEVISQHELDISGVIKDEKISINSNLKKFQTIRLIRELFWAIGKWNTKELNKWLDKFSPNIIFFCAGDSIFAYKIASFLADKYKSKLVVYITDDYVLPRNSINPFWWIRRNIILKQMRRIVKKSDLFMTISDKMKNIYKNFLGRDSIVAVNMTDSMKLDINDELRSDEIFLVYTGGLHFNRYKTLSLLANSIKKYNRINISKKNIKLRIYSNQKPNKSILNKLNVKGASQYCGSLDSNNLKKVLNECSILVHVESFDSQSIKSTKLSISTKIPEYLSLSKPILAIGPSEVASMEYLSEVAYCITSKKNLYVKLSEFIIDDNLKIRLSNDAANKYKNCHNKLELEKKFKSKICEILSE